VRIRDVDHEFPDPGDLPALQRWGDALDAARAAITIGHLRDAGVPGTLISEFELVGAVGRDVNGDLGATAAAYDRRGLLNVIAWLVNVEIGS
jgi:hypothetical protein